MLKYLDTINYHFEFGLLHLYFPIFSLDSTAICLKNGSSSRKIPAFIYAINYVQVLTIKKLGLFLCLIVCALSSPAQNYTLESVQALPTNGVQAIVDGDQTIGYFVFYKKDMTDKKNDFYGLDLVDAQLKPVHSAKITLPFGAIYLQSVFNGSVFGIMFYNPSKGNYIFISYDKTLQEVGSRITERPNKEEKDLLDLMANKDRTADLFFYYGIRPVAGKGFVRAGFGDTDDRYKVRFYDNTFKQKWSKNTPEDAKGYEAFTLSDINAHYITGFTLRKSHAMVEKIETALTVFEVETGKKLLDLPIQKDKEPLAAMATFLTEDTTKIMVQGEYFDKNNKPGIDKSLGLFFHTYDLNTKKEIYTTRCSWVVNYPKLFDENIKKGVDNKFLNFPHVMRKTSDGHYLLVFEQYKKVVNAGGFERRVTVGVTEFAQIETNTIWMLELNEQLKPIAANSLEKKGKDLLCPVDMDMLGAGFPGAYSKGANGFHFQHLLLQDGKSTAICSNNAHAKGSGGIYGVSLTKNDTAQSINVTVPDDAFVICAPANAVHTMLAQYQPSSKQLALKIVK
jgi:hypothetical protein